MEDQDVGALWRHWREFDIPDSTSAPADICRLIRKLVKERAKFYATPFSAHAQEIAHALKDFGIPPETWKE